MTSDEQAITNVIADYGHLLDTGDVVAVGALWTDDGVLHVFGQDYVGRDAIAELMAGAYRGKHLSGAPTIHLDGDGARARTGYAFWLGTDLSLSSVGRYEDDLVRTGEGWRFVRREIVLEFRARQ